jgi:hypothetical protein
MKRSLFLSVLLLIAVTCGACSQSPEPHLFVGNIPERAVTPDDYKQGEAFFTLEGNEHHPDLIFGSLNYKGDELDPPLCRPVILRRDGKQWKVVDAGPEGFLQCYAWVHVAQSLERPEIWALADWAIEDPGWELEVIHSGDGGKSWQHIGTIPKPYYLSEFVYFRMGPDGKGTVVYKCDPVGGGAGFHRYRTADGGRTWSKSGYEPDLLEAAESCEGLPKKLDEIVKSLEKSSR